MAYGKLIASQAGLLIERGYTAEAEQTLLLANQMAPTSPEAVYRYLNLLLDQGRLQEAIPIAENAMRLDGENKQFQELVRDLQNMKK